MRERNILITESDMLRLEELLETARDFSERDHEYLNMLRQELDRALIVSAREVPPDVITMNSRVVVMDLDSREKNEYTLVFPGDADLTRQRISVLAPIGTALLGYRVGDVIEWKVPSGKKRWRVERLLYQPEAAGHAELPRHRPGFNPLSEERKNAAG